MSEKPQLQAVWFAAGTAVLLACAERAVVVSIFRQWHMRVFLALNLLFIAILFTSTHPSRKSRTSQDPGKEQQPAEDSHRDATVDDDVKSNVDNISNEEGQGGNLEDEEDNGGEDQSALLSNEELNERAEAFISRFRQQYLVSDVKISRSRSDIVCSRAVLSKSVTV